MLIILWPILSIPAQVFTKSYFAFWVVVSIAWGFGAAIVISVLPLWGVRPRSSGCAAAL